MTPYIPFISLKGGTGKTTVSMSVACALRDKRYKVGLLDVDIHASALPRAIGLRKPPGYEALRGGLLQPVTHQGLKIFSIGLLFEESTPNMWNEEMKASGVKQIATTSINWGDLDWIIVDTPPTSGVEVQVLLESLDNIHGAVVVCQPNDLSVLGITKTLEVLREKQTPVSGILANMFGYTCPNCGFTSNPFDRSAEDVAGIAKQFNIPYLGAIPFGNSTQRAPAVMEISSRIIHFPGVNLKMNKGGLKRWAIGKAAKWIG